MVATEHVLAWWRGHHQHGNPAGGRLASCPSLVVMLGG
jgi:hypothetical protein